MLQGCFWKVTHTNQQWLGNRVPSTGRRATLSVLSPNCWGLFDLYIKVQLISKFLKKYTDIQNVSSSPTLEPKNPLTLFSPAVLVWPGSFVCLRKCINTLESTLWERLLSFQIEDPSKPINRNTQDVVTVPYARSTPELVLQWCWQTSATCHPRLISWDTASYSWGPDPLSLLTAQLTANRSEHHLST